jgi:hypothetical protein
MSVTKPIRKARKVHRCDGCDRPGKIQPGDPYLAMTLFPSDDSHSWVKQVPMRFAECSECASRYGRGELLFPVLPGQLTIDTALGA